MVDTLIDLARSLMFFLDNVVYGLIPIIYKLFIYLSEVDLFTNNDAVSNLMSHVYVLLGIFMLFKISFSLLQYIVDPNSFRDSSKGMGKLVTNVLVALILLVSVPTIFSTLMALQSDIVQSNAIGQLILGTNTTGSGITAVEGKQMSVEGVTSMAKDLQFMLYGTFYSINEDVMDAGNPVLAACKDSTGILGSTDMALASGGECLNEFAKQLDENDDASSNGVTLYSFFKYVDENGEVQDQRSFEDFGRLLTWKHNGTYVIDYLPFISAAAGVYVAFLLISFSVDVAIRAIKLFFLQMVAPIAIMSYIDPKESIGNGKLHNWITECAKTYFSLFLRLATIFLVMFVISAIASTVISNGSNIGGLLADDPGYNIWVYLFLVLGAFMFAKQVPNMIESLFGIKGSGDLSLNPFKNAGFAALTGGAVGLGMGTVGALTGSGIGRGLTGAISGFTGGLQGKKLTDITRAQADTNRRMGMAIANGSTFTGRMGARWSSFWGTPGRLGREINKSVSLESDKHEIEDSIRDSRRKIALNQTTISSIDEMKKRAAKKIQEGRGAQGAHYQYMLRQAAEAEAQGYGSTAEKLRQEAQSYLYGKGTNDYITENLDVNNKDADMAMQSLYDTAVANANLSGHVGQFSRDGNVLDNLGKTISAETSQLVRDNIPKEQEIKDLQSNIDESRDKTKYYKSNVEAVNGHEGGPRGYRGPRPRGGRFRGPRP